MADKATEQKQIDEAVARVQEMNERLLEASKGAGLASLDAYEKTVSSMLAFQKQAANATQIDWINEFAAMQANYIKAISQAYTNAARKMLS